MGGMPKWPLVVMITADDFVSKHRECLSINRRIRRDV